MMHIENCLPLMVELFQVLESQEKVVSSLCHKTNEAKLFFNFSNNCFTTFKLMIVGCGETGSMYVQR